jgi:hypothetical protein
MTDYFRGFALAGLMSTPDPRETARIFAAGLIYIRLEHYVMGARASPREKVIEAIDHFLGFFLTLFAVKDGGGTAIEKNTKANTKPKKARGGTRGKTAAD